MKFPATIIVSTTAFLTTPAAACVANIEVLSPSVSIRSAPSFSDATSRERFQVRVHNISEEKCVLELGLTLDPASAGEFPRYSIVGPGGVIEFDAQSMSAANGSGELRTPLTLDPGAERTFDYNVATSIGWDLPAGSYTRRLRFNLVEAGTNSEVDQEEIEFDVTVPLSSQIDFVGNIDQIALGRLSLGRENFSPPFGIRVYSTSSYNMQFESENAGNMRKEDGTALLPYLMTLKGRELNLASGGDTINGLSKPADIGDVFNVVVRVNPEPTTPAGFYADRVNVTVTPY